MRRPTPHPDHRYAMTIRKHHTARSLIFALLGLLTAGTSLAAGELTPALHSSINSLGQLNGQALACQQMALSTRLRNILINEAPKERNVGEVFEQATHDAYLAQGQSNKACPSSKALASRIEAATADLHRALGEQR